MRRESGTCPIRSNRIRDSSARENASRAEFSSYSALETGNTSSAGDTPGRGGSAVKEKKKDPMAKAMDLTFWQSAKTDPQGSWTGTPADPWEKPVQDADDL